MLWIKGQHPSLPGWTCPLRALTGVPCPTCFLTRAAGAALSGDLAGSLRWHAFGPALAAGLVVWSLWALQRRRLVPKSWRRGPPGQITRLVVALLGTALLAYWALRLQASSGNVPALAALAFPPS